MPFCQTGQETGKVTGALKDFLTHARNNLGRQNISFITTPYATVSEALDAMKTGEVDSVFPVYLSSYDADAMNIWVTDPAMKTGINVLIRNSEEQSLSRESKLKIAVTEGNMNVDTFIKEKYPGCRILTFPDEQACYAAVAAETADCTLISNYRTPGTEELFRKYGLYSIPTGEHIPFSFAVNKADRDLYFVLNKMVLMTKNNLKNRKKG